MNLNMKYVVYSEYSLYEVFFLVKILLLSLAIFIQRPGIELHLYKKECGAGIGQPVASGHLVHQYDRA